MKRFILGLISASVLATGLLVTPAAALVMALPQCPDTTTNLYRGAHDYNPGSGPVTQLQNFLIAQGFLAYGNNSGYFGRVTERALKRYQQAYGIVSYGSAYSTGFGVYGPATRSYVAQHCSGGTRIDQCPVISMAYPSCPAGEQAVAQYNAQGCVTGYRCPSWNTQNGTPVINSFTGPTRLSLNQTGTWSLQATDPESSTLSYRIDWGDVQNGTTLMAPQSLNGYSQTSTFTHSYSSYGTYTVRITVTDPQGLSATTTSTVVVDSGSTSTSTITVLQPNGGTYYSGNTMPISWTDTSSYLSSNYNVTLVNSNYVGCTVYGCSTPAYSYPIITGAYTSPYNWQVPSSVPAGSYLVQVCRTGTNTCDVSDNIVYINQAGTSSNFTVSPTSGSSPLAVTATANIQIPAGSTTSCGTLTYGTVDWGDGTTDQLTYLGCSTGTQNMSRSHTYYTNATYSVRLIVNGSVLNSQSVVVGQTNTTFSSLYVTPSSVNRGEVLNVQWSLPSSWSDARIRLQLHNQNGNPVGEAGIVSQLPAQSGSYAWVIPSANEACVADAGRVCGANIIGGNSYIVRAIVYTPSNACFGYCGAGYQPTILGTRDSSSFVINGGNGTGYTPSLSVSNDGVTGAPFMVTATTNTPTSGTGCSASDSILDWGDGQTQQISATNNGSYSCSVRTSTNTHYYSAPGTYNIILRSSVYPYTSLANQTLTVN